MVFLLAFLFLPSQLGAAEIQAGFPPQSIWVSKSTAVAGESLEIFTVVHNGSDATLSGTVAFFDNEKRIETENFKLSAETSQLVTIEWKATPGEHAISAIIEGASVEGISDSIALSQRASASIKITVAEPPPPPAIVNAATEASAFIAETAKTASPVVQATLKNVLGKTEEFREQKINSLETYLRGGGESAILGTSTTAVKNVGVSSNTTGFKGPTENSTALEKMKHAAAVGTLTILKSKALFYFLLILALFGGLYLLFRWAFRRPKF